MATLVIDRAALPEPVSSCFAAPRIAVIPQQDGDVTLSPIIDPEDYDNDTDYLNAIPGMMESINEGIDAPDSECDDMPEMWPDVDNRKCPSLSDLVGKVKFRDDNNHKSMRAEIEETAKQHKTSKERLIEFYGADFDKKQFPQKEIDWGTPVGEELW